MAKAVKKKEESTVKKFVGIDADKINDFSAINEFMSQFGNDSDASLLEDYEEIEVPDWIHTGHYLYNAHISGSLRKGYPAGKVITIPGDPKAGKSFLINNGLREAQKKGYFIKIYETENAPDKERFRKQGIDPKGVRMIQPETVSDIIVDFTQMTETMLALKKAGKPYPKVAVAIDSLTALNSQKQYDDANKGVIKADQGTIAKDIVQLFNMMTVRCGKLGILWLNTMHVYDKDMGNNWKVKTPSGGNGPLYMSSVVSILTKKYLKDEETKIKHGVLVTATMFESRYASHHNVDMYINFDKGMNEFLGLQEYVSWDVCGIDKGKVTDFVDLGYEVVMKKIATYDTIVGYVIDDAFLSKLSIPKKEFIKYSLEKSVCDGYLVSETDKKGLVTYRFTKKILERFLVDGATIKYKYKTGDEQIAVPNPTSITWAVKHLASAVTLQELFTKEIFTPEIIAMIDEKKIMPKFRLSSVNDISDDMRTVEEEEMDVVLEITDENQQ